MANVIERRIVSVPSGIKMITITNEKVAGFEPRWAKFKGFSLLFDNPGESLSPMDGLLKIACRVDTTPELQFYSALAKSLEKIGLGLLTNAYLFCPLPPSSYHVTTWDGGNDSNAGNVVPQYRLAFEDFIRGLPDSLFRVSELTNVATESSLATTTGWMTKFKFDKLSKWGNQVLVARLIPADEDSQKNLERIARDRKNLCDKFQEMFGISGVYEYNPHVSLGYFANKEYAEHATPHMDQWAELIKTKTNRLTISFKSVSLYGFTDMATFFKPGA